MQLHQCSTLYSRARIDKHKTHLVSAVVTRENAVRQHKRDTPADGKGTTFSLRIVLDIKTGGGVGHQAAVKLYMRRRVPGADGHRATFSSHVILGDNGVIHFAGRLAIEREEACCKGQRCTFAYLRFCGQQAFGSIESYAGRGSDVSIDSGVKSTF